MNPIKVRAVFERPELANNSKDSALSGKSQLRNATGRAALHRQTLIHLPLTRVKHKVTLSFRIN